MYWLHPKTIPTAAASATHLFVGRDERLGWKKSIVEFSTGVALEGRSRTDQTQGHLVHPRKSQPFSFVSVQSPWRAGALLSYALVDLFAFTFER